MRYMSEAVFNEKVQEWEKRCPKCRALYRKWTKEGLVVAFYRNKRTPDGLAAWCKRCLNINKDVTRAKAMRKRAGLAPVEYHPSYAPVMVY